MRLDPFGPSWGTATNPVWYDYNEMGQMRSMRTYRSGITSSDVDTAPSGLGSGGDLTTWAFDAETGVLEAKTDGAGTTGYEYDDMGRIAKRTDARGSGWATTYTYTGVGLPQTTNYADSVTTDLTYGYDRAGRLTSVSDATGTRTLSYYDTWSSGVSYDEANLRDKSARLKAESFTSGFYGPGRALNYDYQYAVTGRANGPLSTLKIDAGGSYQVGYTYDGYGRFASATYNSQAAFNYAYVPNANLVDTITQAGGYSRDFDYETTSNRVEALKHGWNALAASALESRLTYNALGRRDTEKFTGTGYMVALGRGSEQGAHVDFGYSARSEVQSSGRRPIVGGALGLLIAASERAYTYDGQGNRATGTIGDSLSGSYAANSLNQYTSGPGIAATPTYDANGNMTSDGTRTYTYDGENRLITVTQGASSWTYTYDYLSRRVKKTGTGISEVRYLYEGWNLIAELDASGNLVRRFAWGLDASNSLQGAGGVGGLLVMQDSSGQYSPAYDSSHNVVALYSSTGTFAAAYEYDPFGRVQTATGSYAATNPFRAATKYTDAETGLLYYGYRFYSSLLGRFINRDSIGEAGGINLYAFCGNDGVNRFDYLGMIDNEENSRKPERKEPPLPPGLEEELKRKAKKTEDDERRTAAIGEVGVAGWLMHGGRGNAAVEQAGAAAYFKSLEKSDVTERKNTDAPNSGGVPGNPNVQPAAAVRGGSALGRVASGALDLIGKVWNLPNTVIGVTVGFVGYGVGKIMGTDPGISFGHNGIQFTNNPAMFLGGAITLGNAIIYAGNAYRDEYGIPAGRTPADSGFHEKQHTYQGQVLGPAYLPAAGLSLLLGTLLDGDSHGPHSFMEKGPQMTPPQPWP